MTQDRVIDMLSAGLWTVLTTSLPPLLIGLGVGLIVSIFQTVTSIQEQTLSFIPKIIAVLGAIVVFGPFMITNVVEYFQAMVSALPQIVGDARPGF